MSGLRVINVHYLHEGNQHGVIEVLAETRAEAVEQAKHLVPHTPDTLWMALEVKGATNLNTP